MNKDNSWPMFIISFLMLFVQYWIGWSMGYWAGSTHAYAEAREHSAYVELLGQEMWADEAALVKEELKKLQEKEDSNETVD